MTQNQVWKWSSPSNYSQDSARLGTGPSVQTLLSLRHCPYCLKLFQNAHALGGHIKMHREEIFSPIPKSEERSQVRHYNSAITTIQMVQDALEREHLKQQALSLSAATTSARNTASPPSIATQNPQASSSLSMYPTTDTVQINYQPNPTCLKAGTGSHELDLTLRL